MLTVNLKTKAAAQNTLEFNSMCKFGNVSLGASSGGLYLIGGYTDTGVAIPSLIRSGVFDLGTERLKRFRFFYFGLDTTGDLDLTIFCDGVEVATYTVDVGDGGVREVRVPVTRTAQGRYWQWQIENVGGSFFSLYSVKALPIVL